MCSFFCFHLDGISFNFPRYWSSTGPLDVNIQSHKMRKTFNFEYANVRNGCLHAIVIKDCQSLNYHILRLQKFAHLNVKFACPGVCVINEKNSMQCINRSACESFSIQSKLGINVFYLLFGVGHKSHKMCLIFFKRYIEISITCIWFNVLTLKKENLLAIKQANGF